MLRFYVHFWLCKDGQKFSTCLGNLSMYCTHECYEMWFGPFGAHFCLCYNSIEWLVPFKLSILIILPVIVCRLPWWVLKNKKCNLIDWLYGSNISDNSETMLYPGIICFRKFRYVSSTCCSEWWIHGRLVYCHRAMPIRCNRTVAICSMSWPSVYQSGIAY